MEWLRGPTGCPSPARTIVDGLTLSLLVVLVFVAERFDRAQRAVDGLAGEFPEFTPESRALIVDEAAPNWLHDAWIVVAVVGVAGAAYVAVRFVRISDGLLEAASAWRRLAVRVLAVLAVGGWLLWHVGGLLDVRGVEVPDLLIFVLAGIAIVAAVVGVLVAGPTAGGVLDALEKGSVVRLQLAFLLLLFLAVFVLPFSADQMTDVLRGWADERPSRALAGIASALLLGAVLRASAVRLLVPAGDASWADPPFVLGVVAPLGVAALLFVLGLEAAAILVALVVGVVAATQPAPGSRITHRLLEPDGSAAERVSLERLASTLGTVPLAILVVGLTLAATDSLLLRTAADGGSDLGLVGWALAAAVLFGLLAARAHAPAGVRGTVVDDRVPGWLVGVAGLAAGLLLLADATASALVLALLAAALAFKVFACGAAELWAGWGMCLGIGVAIYVEPLEAARRFGAFGLALVGATLVLLVLHLAGAFSLRRRLSATFCGWRPAPPVLILVAVWLAVAQLTAPDRAHRARTVPTSAQPRSLADAVSAWLDEQPRPEPGGYVPMLIVGASGGGSKAAYWTALVLDCMFGADAPAPRAGDECKPSRAARPRARRLFLTSSVSGGSIGIHHFVARGAAAGTARQWVEDSAGGEVLSPLLGWAVFHDLPAFALGFDTDPRRCADPLDCPVHADRAAVQEAAIATGPMSRRGLLDQPPLPVTIFNTTVDDAPRDGLVGFWELTDRALLSRLALREGCLPADGHDVLPGEDLPLITAALLSARFPGLEPKGTLGDRWCGGDGPLTLRDGGIVENTGVLTVLDLLPEVLAAVDTWKAERRARAGYDVRAVIVSIDDDVEKIAGDTEYDGGTAAGRTRQARRRIIDCSSGDVTYRRISPAPHVGAQAATGWELSKTSRRDDLGRSLDPSLPAGAAVQELRDILDGLQRPSGCVARRPR